MTRRRWIADEHDVARNRAALLGEHAAHLSRTLRAKVGQQFEISVGPNSAPRTYLGTILSVSDSRVEFELGAPLEGAPGLYLKISLLLAVFKFDRMEWAIEKATELGVAAIYPVIARRTEKRFAEAATKRGHRWQRIALQAAEQSRRAELPSIAEPVPLLQALSLEGDLRIVLSEREGCLTLPDSLSSGFGRSLILAIGPEGGWTDDELADFTEAGWKPASLGTAILRAETAAVAAIAICIAASQTHPR